MKMTRVKKHEICVTDSVSVFRHIGRNWFTDHYRSIPIDTNTHKMESHLDVLAACAHFTYLYKVNDPEKNVKEKNYSIIIQSTIFFSYNKCVIY